MKTWFSSDLHVFHRNITRFSDRPFVYWGGALVKPSETPLDYMDPELTVDLEAMNRTLKDNWNQRVGPRDIVYLLGDYSMGTRADAAAFFPKLNGKVILIKGNHDRSKTAMLEMGFAEVHDELRIDLDGHKLYLRHKPERDRKKWQGADYCLHGHVHEIWRRQGDLINVGVDVWNYIPVSLDELLTCPQDLVKVDASPDEY